MPAEFTFDDKKLQELIRESPERIDKCIRATARMVQGRAVGNLQTMNAVDTGATMNSVFVKDSKSNGYLLAQAGASSKRQGVETVDGTPGDARSMEAFISAATNYAIWIELGSSRNRTGPRPFLSQAAEPADGDFERFVKKEFENG